MQAEKMSHATPRRNPNIETLERRVHLAAQVIGIQSAALDQPRINAYVSRTPNGLPLTDIFGFDFFNIDAFFDTGASGVLISSQTSEFLDINRATFNGQDVIFSDIGVGGSEDFWVSEQLYLSLAKYHPDADIDDLDTYEDVYTQQFGALRTQLGPVDAPPNPFLEGLDVIGMPAMAGKVVVMDPKPVDTFLDTMRTYVYNPGTPFNPAQADFEPGIPSINTQIQMSYVSFDRFTQTTPAGAPGPTLRNNPFIGRNPFLPGDTSPRPVAEYNNFSSQGDWLFDTGAAASIISQARAAELGVTYVPGTYGTTAPALQGLSPGTRQFQLTIGGIGGEITLKGFFMDSLTLPTVGGEGLEYIGAPVLIGDITVFDPILLEQYTLDGILGMNYFVASCNITQVPGQPFPTIDDLTIGAYDWITFNENTGRLGLELRDQIPAPDVIDDLFEYDVAPNSYYFQFSRDVGDSLSLADLVVQNLTTGQTISSGQLSLAWEPTLNTATLQFPGYANATGILPDGNYRVTVVADGIEDIFGIQMIDDFIGNFYSLAGDADRNRIVDLGDFSTLASNFGEDGQTWAGGDFNLDEMVDIGDFALLAANYNKSIPTPPESARGAGPIGSVTDRPSSPFSLARIAPLVERLQAAEGVLII